MELNQILGYAGALFTGLVLGLLGGGGALLSIPVLYYFFNIDMPLATGYSLFLIAVTASSGAYGNIRKKLVDYNAAIYYGVPSVITLFVVRRFVMPAIPQVIFHTGNYTLSKGHLILFVLSLVMLLAAWKMISDKNDPWEDNGHRPQHIRLALSAIVIGAFFGLVGAGGGFLMVPVLIYFAKLPPKKAIGTSLLLVAINSFIGFVGDLGAQNRFNWRFLLVFCLFSIIGLFAGQQIANHVQNHRLKKLFGWFILIIALMMDVKEIFF